MLETYFDKWFKPNYISRLIIPLSGINLNIIGYTGGTQKRLELNFRLVIWWGYGGM